MYVNTTKLTTYFSSCSTHISTQQSSDFTLKYMRTGKPEQLVQSNLHWTASYQQRTFLLKLFLTWNICGEHWVRVPCIAPDTLVPIKVSCVFLWLLDTVRSSPVTCSKLQFSTSAKQRSKNCTTKSSNCLVSWQSSLSVLVEKKSNIGNNTMH